MTDPSIRASGPLPEQGGPPSPLAPPPLGPGVMRAEYTLTLDDAAAFFRYDITLSPRARRKAGIPSWVWLIALGVVISVGLLIRLMLEPKPYSLSLLDVVFAAAMIWFLTAYFLGNRLTVLRSLRAVRRDARFFQKKTTTISPEGVSVSDPSGHSTTHWHTIVWLVEHGEHAFFYITEKKVFILPKRAFPDERRFEEFMDTARGYHAEAHRFLRGEGEA